MLNPGSTWHTQQYSRLQAWMSGISEAVMTNSVAAAKKEHASRTLGRLPASMTRPAPRSGARIASRSVMSGVGSIGLAVQFGQLPGLDGAVVAIDSDDDAEGNGDFSRRQPHDEQDKDLPDSRVGRPKAIESHQVERGGGEDQLARNEHADEGAAPQQAKDANGQQKRGDDIVDVWAVG